MEFPPEKPEISPEAIKKVAVKELERLRVCLVRGSISSEAYWAYRNALAKRVKVLLNNTNE